MAENNLVIEKFDDVFVKLHADDSLILELAEYFTFYVPGYQYMPKYRSGAWDGKIRLLNRYTRKIYAGLISKIVEYCLNAGYTGITVDPYYFSEELSLVEAQQWLETLNIPSSLTPRNYQVDAFVYSVRNKRALLLSPTASGKSLMIYLLLRWFKQKTLLIVPTTALVHQMFSDFEEYGFDSKTFCHKIYEGQPQTSPKPFFISTWQSIYDNDPKWFQQFKVVVGDEAHLFKANSLKSIMESLTHCPYRFATTGTLDGTLTHELVLQGLFGEVRKVASSSELMEQKILADLNIKAIILGYPDHIRRKMTKSLYQAELDFLTSYEPRNRFIKNLALSLEGNTLLLFQYVDKHGKILYNMLNGATTNGRNVYFIHGKVDGEEREEIRKIVNKESNAIIVASYGTFQTGVNIPNLHNLITASPAKSRIRVLQSIGRALRIGDSKYHATLLDISDDLQWKTWTNHTLKHFQERIGIYAQEGFKYKTYRVNIGV